jgi:hypothetical protein
MRVCVRGTWFVCVQVLLPLFVHMRSHPPSPVTPCVLVCLNGCGTAHYDPRPAVSTFLNRRERRYQNPDISTYSGRDFAKKFFRADGLL